MLWITALGVVLALMAPNIPGRCSCYTDELAAEVQMSNFAAAIDMHRTSHGHLPAHLDDLTKPLPDGPYPIMKTIPLDPWGSAYVYERLSADTFHLRSDGEDGQPGTDDDVVWPIEGD